MPFFNASDILTCKTRGDGLKRKAFKAALPYTLPICAGFSFLGLAYGILMQSNGYSFWWTLLMSSTIFAGSMEFVTVQLLSTVFNPIYAFLLSIMVNARHLFYGLSMLEKFKGTGWKKFFLIYGMCDESFSINVSTNIPKEVDKGWFMLFVTLLNYTYWVISAVIGTVLGGFIQINTEGIEFVMTALFIVIFIDQWRSTPKHAPSIIGLGASSLCLVLVGKDNFLILAMAVILLILLVMRKMLEGESKL